MSYTNLSHSDAHDDVSTNSSRDIAPSSADILQIFQISPDNLEECFVYRSSSNHLHLRVKLVKEDYCCPICNSSHTIVKGYYKKHIRHSVLVNYPCDIEYHSRRFICKACGKTFSERNPFALASKKISSATVYNVLRDLKPATATFKEVASRYHVSTSTAIRLFDKYINISRGTLPEYLCIDEVHGFNNTATNSIYVCVLLDFKTQKIIDIIPDRRKATLIDYFFNIPLEEREKVKYVSFDMWETYRDVAQTMFPHSRCIVDRFHLVQELGRKNVAVRISVMNKYYAVTKKYKFINKKTLTPEQFNEFNEADKNYYLLKKFNWVLNEYYTNKNFDPNKEKKFNHKLNQYLNFYDIRAMILDMDDTLVTAYNLYQDFMKFYRENTLETAPRALNKLIGEFRNCGIADYAKFANTLTNWRKEIINSFNKVPMTDDLFKNVNNGIIENRNRTIKLLKNTSNGYTDFNRFRNRAMYAVNEDLVISVPTEKDKK